MRGALLPFKTDPGDLEVKYRIPGAAISCDKYTNLTALLHMAQVMRLPPWITFSLVDAWS